MSVRSHWLTNKRIGALLFLGLSLFYGWQIPDIPQLPVDEFEAMNARSMPWVLAVVGSVLSLALFISDGSISRAPDENSSELGSSLRHEPINIATAVTLLIWTALFANLLDWLGFFAATALFLLGGFGLLGERRPKVVFAVALIAAGLLYLLLRFALGLYLPDGSLFSQLFGAGHV